MAARYRANVRRSMPGHDADAACGDSASTCLLHRAYAQANARACSASVLMRRRHDDAGDRSNQVDQGRVACEPVSQGGPDRVQIGRGKREMSDGLVDLRVEVSIDGEAAAAQPLERVPRSGLGERRRIDRGAPRSGADGCASGLGRTANGRAHRTCRRSCVPRWAFGRIHSRYERRAERSLRADGLRPAAGPSGRRARRDFRRQGRFVADRVDSHDDRRKLRSTGGHLPPHESLFGRRRDKVAFRVGSPGVCRDSGLALPPVKASTRPRRAGCGDRRGKSRRR